MDLTNGKDRAGGNPYFPPVEDGARYLLEILQCRELNGRKGKAFVVSFKVETSSEASVLPGEEYDWYVNMSTPEFIDFAIPDVRMFLQAVLGLKTPEDKQKHNDKYNAYFQASYSEKQPFKGKKVRLNTSMSKKGTFTKHFFHPVT